MRAIQVEGQTKRLYIAEVSDPVVGEDELLVAIKATALNRADLLQVLGKYPPPPGASEIIGLEMAGVVQQVGSKVVGWQAGDRVCALLPGGGYAQQAVIPADMAMPIPDAMSWEEAAAIPEAYLTAYLNLFVLGRLAPGEHVLIHAGASGVGTAAIQLVKEAGAIALVTAGSAEKLAVCAALGAQCMINYKEEDFVQQVMAFTGNRGVDMILDPIGAAYWQQNDQCLNHDARWVLIGGLGGYVVEELQIQSFMRRRIQLIFSTLRSRSDADKISLTRQFRQFAADGLESGRLRPVIDRIYHWTEVEQAHDDMRHNRNSGKIVLQVD